MNTPVRVLLGTAYSILHKSLCLGNSSTFYWHQLKHTHLWKYSLTFGWGWCQIFSIIHWFEGLSLKFKFYMNTLYARVSEKKKESLWVMANTKFWDNGRFYAMLGMIIWNVRRSKAKGYFINLWLENNMNCGEKSIFSDQRIAAQHILYHWVTILTNSTDDQIMAFPSTSATLSDCWN